MKEIYVKFFEIYAFLGDYHIFRVNSKKKFFP